MNQRRPKIEAIYPLSPMQQGMLFHSLYAEQSSVYFEQNVIKFKTKLSKSNFKLAWQQVMARHAVLRTLVVWEQQKKPLQVVRQEVELPWTDLDWRFDKDIEEQLELYLAAEREQGFELDRAPLMRFALIQVADESYYFVWNYHHLLLDGWSTALLLQEVWAFYEAACRGQRLAIPRPRPYKNYMTWLQQQDQAQAQRYWQQALEGFTAPTPLVVAHHGLRGRAPIPIEAAYSEHEVSFSSEETATLQKMARENRLTLNTVIQGAWALLLSRYSGEEEVLFGATVSGRPPELSGVERMIGLFINTLPVRVAMPADMPLLTWLENLQQEQRGREQYAYTPLIDIQGWSQIPRGTALFESLLVYENYPIDREGWKQKSELQITDLRSVEQTNYPLTLVVMLTEPDASNALGDGTQLCLRFSYDTSRFEGPSIRRMAGHFQTLLAGFVANPNRCLAHLPLLTEREKHQLLIEWNDTQTDYPREKCIHQLFEEQVERTPEATAVIFDDEVVTYRELNAKANQLAHYLIAQGVGPEMLVGITVERSIDMVVAMLGILKAGGAYVPLDPSYPAERLAFMLSDAQVCILLTQEQFVERLSEQAVPLFSLDSARNMAAESKQNPPNRLGPESLAYVIYTSGSTGRPKGVMVPHCAINRLINHTNYIEITPSDRMAQASNASFDAATFEIWGALLHGACLVGIEHEVAISPRKLALFLQQQEISILFLTTALFNQVVSYAPEAFGNLRYLLFGGEVVDPISVRKLLQVGAPEHFLHVYGPTENTTYSSWFPIQSVAEEAITVPIGFPIANTQIYILDRQLQPVPVNVPGELYLGGDGLALGYLNRPQLTAERFIPNPFGPGKLYKTGDLCRYILSAGKDLGRIEFLGRADYQVKVRGFRIELGEIEAHLRQCSGVREAVVVMLEEVTGKRLVAYVTFEDGMGAEAVQLRGQLSQKLPDYMIPSLFVSLEAMPLTPNGKIDRRALPTPEYQVDSTQLVSPLSPLETILAEIWQEVLGMPVGRHDNFFEIGGHSLLATQIVSRIRQIVQVELPLRELFTAPTIAELATQVSHLQGSALPPLEPVARPERLPLSFAQQRLWFLAQLEGSRSTYNIPAALRLEGQLDVDAFNATWQIICERHEVLRTTFPVVDGQAHQQINAPHFNLELIDLSDLPLQTQEAEVVRLARYESGRSFDLINGPLWHVTLLRLGEYSHVLLLTMHHIISDGWSIGVLIREFSALYAQQADRSLSTSQMLELPIQYADFALWQREWLTGDLLTQQLAYWEKQLADAPPLLTLPTDHARPAVQSYRGAHLTVTLPKRLTGELKRLSQKNNTTLFMTLQAAFAVLLSRYSAQEEILIGTPIANRQVTEVENLIGFFVNTLVLRNDLSALGGLPPSFSDILSRVRQVALDAYQHQALPFELLVERLQPERSLSHSPLFQVMFILQNNRQEALSFSGLTVTPIEVENATSKFDLTLAMEEGEEGLVSRWSYNSDLFEHTTIQRMATHFQTLLEGIVANPNQRLADLPLLSNAEKDQLLVQWNNTQADYPADKCIHQLFEEQVARTPDAVAVIYDSRWTIYDDLLDHSIMNSPEKTVNQLTYRELNARTNQLAHYLISQGVGPDIRVGICVERSLEMVIAVLAILKAGGIYVPLDPNVPAERRAFIRANADLSLILVQEETTELFEHDSITHQTYKLVSLDKEWSLIALMPTHTPQISLSATNPAYIVYTSGSTGRPKGVLGHHRGVVNYLDYLIKTYNLNQSDVVLQLPVLTFDASIRDMLGPLTVGAKVLLLHHDATKNAPLLLHQIQEYDVTCLLSLVPTILRMLIETGTSDNQKRVDSIRLLLVSGEPLYLSTCQQARELFGQETVIVNQYGPTECTMTSTYYPVPQNQTGGMALVGRPIQNSQVYILDANLNPVPPGVYGEVYIGGVGVTYGYLNQEEQTRVAFIPNPFTPKPSLLYKTGDLARYQPTADGGLPNIEFLRRIDHQIKIRGIRIELGEIESALNSQPNVREAVVMLHHQETNASRTDKRLVAYVTGEVPSKAQLRHKLPDYMIPHAFVELAAMPLTSTGKIDRRALPAPSFAEVVDSAQLVLPRTPLETILAAIWQEVLGVKQVGIHDNFFEIGGHSLLATQAVLRIRQLAQVELPLRNLFEMPTIAELAELIEALEAQREVKESDDASHDRDVGEI